MQSTLLLMWKPSPCLDCGPDTVSHIGHRFGIVFEEFFEPLNRLSGFIWRGIGPLFLLLPWEYVALFGFSLMRLLGLARFTHIPDTHDNLRTRALWESAKKRGITLREFRLFGMPETGVFVARSGRHIRIFEGLPRPRPILNWRAHHMDNKWLLKQWCLRAGIPVAKGAVCRSPEEAVSAFRLLTPPVIVKPHLGSRSRHTTIHIRDESTLLTAFKKAKQLSPRVIVEEELVGDVYRGTLIGKRVVGVMRREMASVLGDGASSIRSLVEKENARKERKGPIFHEIPKDTEADEELARQSFTWDSILPRGVRATLSQKASRSFGASTTDVTDITHPDIIVLLENLAEIIDDDVIGVDFIVSDITRSWKEQTRCGVIECNSLPFIDLHHYPLNGSPRDVAGALWGLVFP